MLKKVFVIVIYRHSFASVCPSAIAGKNRFTVSRGFIGKGIPRMFLASNPF